MAVYDIQDVFHSCVLSQFAGGGVCVFSESLGELLNRFNEVTGACTGEGVMFWLWECSSTSANVIPESFHSENALE